MQYSQSSRLCFAMLFVLLTNHLFAQRWPDDPAGDIAAEKVGMMDGNNVHLQFRNTTELSDWGVATDPYSHKWPRDATGSKLTDGIALLVGARVFVENDSIPVTDPGEIQSRNDLDTLYFCQTHFREEMDRSYTGQVEWGFYPVRGYANDNLWDSSPAISANQQSWPPDGWPTTGSNKAGAGQWFGRRGMGTQNADLECFFVVNDAQDLEYQQQGGPQYYPRPGRYIGDLDPRMSIQVGEPWGGVGLRVAVRGYQWNHELARDIIFWEYAVGNISNYDIPDAAAGFWVDIGLGQDGNDDLASTDELDMVYLWDVNGVGNLNLQTPCIGYAFLETSGQPADGMDNDSDGLIDEKRDNQITRFIGPTEGIADMQRFLDYYHLQESDLREHWDADEDQDWRDGYDTNGNGKYDPGEFAGDDIGLDGKGPGDIGYTGPDEGECNHRPDYIEGQGCEPNFAVLDVNENDMTGVNSFHLFPVPEHRPPHSRWFRNDESMWGLLGESEIVPYSGSVSNLILTFATGPFRLQKHDEQRVSIAELHSFDPIDGFNLTPTVTPIVAPQLHQQKFMAQMIMDADYTLEFMRPHPPAIPSVQAHLNGNSIRLTWDTNAEQNTQEPLLNNRNDFEGYKLFKRYSLNSDGSRWSKDELVLQCDKKDGITGTFSAHGHDYYLGDDSGLVHEFVDKDYYDGALYEYTLVAYDYGLPADSITTPGVPRVSFLPTESRSRVEVKVPYPEPLENYPWEKINEHFVGSGRVVPEIVDPNEVKSKHKYVVKFHNNAIRDLRDTFIGIHYVADGLSVYDITNDNRQLVFKDRGNQPGSIVDEYSVMPPLWSIRTGNNILTTSFEGMHLKLQNTVVSAKLSPHTGWKVGTAPISVTVVSDSDGEQDVYYFPWDHAIVFSDDPNAFVSQLSVDRRTRIEDEHGVRIREGVLGQQSFPFVVQNTTFGSTYEGNPLQIEMVVQDLDLDGQFDMLNDRVLVGYLNSRNEWAETVLVIDCSAATSQNELPQPGDVYQIQFERPFWKQDSLVFVVDPLGTLAKDKNAVPAEMQLCANYPNPFNPTTTLAYSISHRVKTRIDVYNILGQNVSTLVDKVHEPGHYTIQFDGKHLPSGIYFYTLQAGDFFARRKMALVR